MAQDSDAPRSVSEVFPSLSAELLFAANLAASTPGLRTGVADGWVERQRAEMDPRALDLAGVAGTWWPTWGLIDFLAWNRQFHDPQAFLHDIAQAPIERYVELLFNGDVNASEVQTFLSRPQEGADLSRVLCSFSESTPEVRLALFRDPEAHRRALLRLVEAADTPWFRSTWDQWKGSSRPFVKTIEQRLTTEDPMELAQSLRRKNISGVGRFERYTFIPSRLVGHRHIRSWAGGQILFFLQEGSLEAASDETGAELADFLKILGDRTRMDILHLLSRGPSFGKQIAASLGLTTATVSRHLDQLKAAGLVREERADTNNVKLLTLAPEALEGALDRVKTHLLP